MRLRRQQRRTGQATVEFAVAWGAVLVPVAFGIVYTSLLLWVWHSVADMTREGARYAATHCWNNGGGNVIQWMRENAPIMWDRGQFTSGPAEITVAYFARNADSGDLETFTCSEECSAQCVPDVVRVSISGYEYRGFFTALGVPPITIPDFQTTLTVEGAGCDPEQATCLP